MTETQTPPRRRWFQFSLATMFLVVAVFAVPVALVAWVNHSLSLRAQRRAAPLTNEHLDLLARAGLSFAAIMPIKPRPVSIGLHSTKLIGSVEITDDGELDRLILALAPIKVVSAGSLPAGTADYQLSFQGGMDPTLIYVKIVGDGLEFQERGFVYQGGNAKAFRETAEMILGREMQRSAK